MVLTNIGLTPVTWQLEAVRRGSSSPKPMGCCHPASGVSLSVTTAASATKPAPRRLRADLTVSNLTGGVAHAFPLFLAVADPLILTPTAGMAVSGPVGGPFNWDVANDFLKQMPRRLRLTGRAAQTRIF